MKSCIPRYRISCYDQYMPIQAPAEVLIPLFILAVIAHLASLVETGQLLFGVTVTPKYVDSDAARMLRKKYIRRVWIHTLLAAAVPALLWEWNLAVGLLAVTWQGVQAGLGWWGAHMEALANEEDPIASLEYSQTPLFSVLSNIRLVQFGPFLCIFCIAFIVWYIYAFGSQSLTNETMSARQFLPHVLGFLICIFIRISVHLGKTARLPLALLCQYIVAISTITWSSYDLLSTGFLAGWSVIRSVFLIAINHLIFWVMKYGLVGFNPQWESRPGFDSPPVESYSITGSSNLDRERDH